MPDRTADGETSAGHDDQHTATNKVLKRELAAEGTAGAGPVWVRGDRLRSYHPLR